LKSTVLQLIDSFNQGGSERQALQLTRLLCESGRYNVRLASLSPEGSLRNTISDLPLGETPSFPLTSFYDRNATKQLRRFVRWLKSSRIDVIHTHDFYTNIFGMTGGSLARVPARIASMRETAGMRSAVQKQLQRIAYSSAHHVVVNAEAVREKVISFGIRPDKVTVIYNGLDLRRVDTSVSRADALSMLGLPITESESLKFVSIVANMRHEVKDYPMLLRAAQIVKQSVPNAAFMLAGEGELEGSLKKLAEQLGILQSTFFLGRCDKIAELLSVSDICVLTSKAEGFSNSILEYMAAGRPVVATDVGGAGEAIIEGETGYLVTSGDDQQLASRLIELLRDADKASQMGRRGRAVVEEKFSCEVQLSQTERLYEELLVHRKRIEHSHN
jgi:glycosyltransferase involved in cell wall biosynthesis